MKLNATVIRLLIVVGPLIWALHWVWNTDVRPEKVSLAIAAVIGAVTTIYALFTYEILLQNQKMASAAFASTKLMEQNLRFSHSPNLFYKTISTKDPNFDPTKHIFPINNDDYKLALSVFGEGGVEREFVFAIISNKGRGAATNLTVDTIYNVINNSSTTREATLNKRAAVPILEPNSAVALCIFITKIPTPGDRVTLVSASLIAGDFYRDSIKESPQTIKIKPTIHQVEPETNCVVLLA